MHFIVIFAINAKLESASNCSPALHLQDALVLYATVQLNLTRGAADGSSLLEQLVEVLSKELDQLSTSSTNLPWLVFFPQFSFNAFFPLEVLWTGFANVLHVHVVCRNDATRDEKCGILTISQQRFLELAALVFWRVFTIHVLHWQDSYLMICALLFSIFFV